MWSRHVVAKWSRKRQSAAPDNTFSMSNATENPSLQRATALSCAEKRLRQPGVKKTHYADVHQQMPTCGKQLGEDTEAAVPTVLASPSSLGTMAIPASSRPSRHTPISSNLGQNLSKTIKPWDRKAQGSVRGHSSGCQMVSTCGCVHVVSSCGRSKIAKKRSPTKMLPDIRLHDMVKTRVANLNHKHVITATIWDIFFTKHERSSPFQFLLPEIPRK